MRSHLGKGGGYALLQTNILGGMVVACDLGKTWENELWYFLVKILCSEL